MPQKYKSGDTVMDGIRCQAGQVVAVNGDVLTIVRPSGLTWDAPAKDCSPAGRLERERLVNSSRRLRLLAQLGRK